MVAILKTIGVAVLWSTGSILACAICLVTCALVGRGLDRLAARAFDRTGAARIPSARLHRRLKLDTVNRNRWRTP